MAEKKKTTVFSKCSGNFRNFWGLEVSMAEGKQLNKVHGENNM